MWETLGKAVIGILVWGFVLYQIGSEFHGKKTHQVR